MFNFCHTSIIIFFNSLQGLSALHASPVHVHGHLRSSKCLIDSRWVCKVSDYGLGLLKSDQRIQDINVGEHAKYKSKFKSITHL